MSSPNSFDAIVVGGGHNGLAAAAYLSKAGRSVLLLEKLGYTGGAAVSAQAFDGVDARLSRYSYLVSLLPQQVADWIADIAKQRERSHPDDQHHQHGLSKSTKDERQHRGKNTPASAAGSLRVYRTRATGLAAPRRRADNAKGPSEDEP